MRDWLNLFFFAIFRSLIAVPCLEKSLHKLVDSEKGLTPVSAAAWHKDKPSRTGNTREVSGGMDLCNGRTSVYAESRVDIGTY